MRYNKQELYALASQTSQNFEREGVLVLKEKQDGFFRRAEGCTVRWFRLRGNLLFYLKGPEPWYEPMGVIVFGHHHVKVQPQDENGHWPFHIGWDNGVCYKMATFHESERMLWLKAIEMAPYDKITSQVSALRERLNKIRPNLDIAMYRLQKGIVPDMNEVPLCELALSCDNLLCDAYGHPPSPVCIIYVKYLKGLSVRYGSTEIVEKSSNPCFSKTILFRDSDGLTGQAIVRIVVYDVKERVSETAVPIGFTSLQLSTIQEAQRLRVALVTRENKTVGFVTINGWSLEPSYIGTSPSHTTDKNIDIQKVLCHRRSQSLPPRLGLKLKFPCYGTLLKQNFANSTQVTYRFHSGLGGDITVHEVMAEAKICYQFPMQLLDIYIQREKELLEELLSVGEISGQWQTRQLDLVNTHVSLLKHYCHSKKCMQQVDSTYFKASARKADASLEFAPINMHIQRMWVHNDTLNKTGFHDVITVGAFAVHTHKSQRPVGLIRLLQQMKELSSTNAAYTHKIQVEYDKVLAMRQVNGQLITDMERINMMLQAKRRDDVIALLEGIKGKVKAMLSLWDPAAVEESLSYIRWPHDDDNKDNEIQAKSTIMRIMEQLSIYDDSSDCDTYDVSNMSSSSSKDTSPTGDQPSLSASVPNVFQNITDLHFDNDYFYSTERNNLNNSFRSMRSSIKPKRDGTSLSFDGTKRHGSMRSYVKSSASLGQDATKVMDGVGNDKRKGHNMERRDSLPPLCAIDPAVREKNLTYLRRIARNVDDAMQAVVKVVNESLNSAANVEDNLDRLIRECDSLRSAADELPRWLRLSHASLRLRCEAPRVAGEHATLQTRRDSCFSQALTTLTTGLISWLSATPTDVIVKLLSSGLGPVCGFESLLSLHSTEAAMWGDMAVAVEDMHTAAICLTQRTHSNASIPHVTGTRGAITVHIPVSDALYSTLAKKHLTFSVTAVFFNIGVNEKATLAEALGQTLPQYHSNCDNWDRLSKYYNKYTKVITPDLCRTSSSRTKPLEEVMENLRIAIHRKVPKNVEILQLAALATRLMNGIRFTSCKSAKDRTGMSVTLEQCSILAAEYHLAEHEVKKALNIMRSEGCRRENTYKNIGVRKYAFTKTQVMALPEDYRPPPGTYGSSQT